MSYCEIGNWGNGSNAVLGWMLKEFQDAFPPGTDGLNRSEVLAFFSSRAVHCPDPYVDTALTNAQREIEKLRLQLAACGVAAMANTKESAHAQRIAKDNPYYSASYQYVCNAVDREMQLESALKEKEVDLTRTSQGFRTLAARCHKDEKRISELESELKEKQEEVSKSMLCNKCSDRMTAFCQTCHPRDTKIADLESQLKKLAQYSKAYLSVDGSGNVYDAVLRNKNKKRLEQLADEALQRKGG